MSVINKQVKKVGYRIIGHTNDRYIYISFGDGEIRLNPKTPMVVKDGVDKLGNTKYRYPWYELFNVFDIDIENGADIEALQGKYFRLHLDDNYNMTGIQHIVKDNFLLIDWFK